MKYHVQNFDFSDGDYLSAISLRNLLYTDTPSTIEIWQHNDKLRRADPSYHFFVAKDKDPQAVQKIIGYVQCSMSKHNNQTFGLGMICLPDCWSNGVATEMLWEVKKVATKFQANKLVQRVQESDHEKINFFQGQGFKTVMRYPLSVLDLGMFDSKAYAERLAFLAASGIKITRLPIDWPVDPKWQKAIYELDWRLTQEVPYHETRAKESIEKFVENELQHPNSFPESYFIAWDGGKMVGMTCFIKRGGRAETVTTAITGVLPAYRRKGIAFGLKVNSLQFVKSMGCKTVLTNNEENNPMFLLNHKLGFVQKPAWLDLKLEL